MKKKRRRGEEKKKEEEKGGERKKEGKSLFFTIGQLRGLTEQSLVTLG